MKFAYNSGSNISSTKDHRRILLKLKTTLQMPGSSESLLTTIWVKKKNFTSLRHKECLWQPITSRCPQKFSVHIWKKNGGAQWIRQEFWSTFEKKCRRIGFLPFFGKNGAQ